MDLLTKVANRDKSACLLTGLMFMNKKAAAERKQEVINKLVPIFTDVLTKQASQKPVDKKAAVLDLFNKYAVEGATDDSVVKDLTQKAINIGKSVRNNAIAWGAPSAVLGGAATGTGAGVLTDALLTTVVPSLKKKRAARILLASLIGVPAGVIGAAGIGGLGAGVGLARGIKSELPNIKDTLNSAIKADTSSIV